jgi:archaellum component FlaC
MDERKKIIRDLEDKKQADLEGVNRLLENLGETLLLRQGPDQDREAFSAPGSSADNPAGLCMEYRRLLEKIAEDGDSIKSIEADTRRIKELEQEIALKEKQNLENSREISLLYAQLGQYVLTDPAFSGFAGPYRNQIDEILLKIDARETRLNELEQKNGGIFSWIGKNAQGLVVKAALAKNQSDLHKIYRSAGERFAVSGEDAQAGDRDVRELAEKIGDLRRNTEELSAEILSRKEECRKTGELFGAEGSPVKRILNLEKQIARAKEDLRVVYRTFGAYALDPAWKDSFASLITPEDSSQKDKIEALRGSVRETESRIEKLKAAAAIDDEKHEIEKLKRSIEDQRRRIQSARDVIAEMERRIESAEKHIEELTKLL